MSLRRIIQLNVLLVLAVGVYGIVSNEPYWRANGHLPWTYDFLFWAALALNGPSAVVAERLSFVGRPDYETRFLIQYGLWAALLIVQWLTYARIADWMAKRSVSRAVVYGAALVMALAGVAMAAHRWLSTEVSLTVFVDVYFWPVRIVALALVGVWIAMLFARTRVWKARKPREVSS